MKSKLEELFTDFHIMDIAFDSRQVRASFAFFALKGNDFDGNNYIEEAVTKGANLILTDNLEIAQSNIYTNIVYFDDIRLALSIGAEIFYPKLPKYLLAVTGTNGKTSITHYVQQLIELLGERSASIGTLGIQGANLQKIKTLFNKDILTTPNILILRRILSTLAEENVNYIALEASSHGIDQGRLNGLKMQACAFSSFSQDHLDYHKTLDNYLEAKLKLFKENLDYDKSIILNSDMGDFKIISYKLKDLNNEIITVGKNGDLRIIEILPKIQGQEISFSYNDKTYSISTEIIGGFQAYNILIAALLVKKCGFKFEQIVEKLNKLNAVPGRLERVGRITDHFQVFVDYAHTPDAIKQTLIELRKIKNIKAGALIILFGCGGNRDQGKRKIMGSIANEFADKVIITDDNPRDEAPSLIRAQILEGAVLAEEIENREDAIKQTILNLKKDDILLIAGKGHEEYQIIGDKKIPFNDVLIAKQAIRGRNDMVE